MPIPAFSLLRPVWQSLTLLKLMNKYTPDELDLKGKRVLIRVDFNVPLKESDDGILSVADDTRIRAALPTIKAVMEKQARVILMSHLGRPKGERVSKYSLSPVANHLESLLGARVRFATCLTGETVSDAISDMPDGGVILLENTRFEKGETKNDEKLSKELATLADVFINDAFGTAHRAHASTVGVAQKVPVAAMGFLLQKEVKYLGELMASPASPFVAVIGGAKVSDKIGVIEALLDRVDHLLIGGAMSYTFLKALGNEIGTSLYEEDKLEDALALYNNANGRIKLPVDHIIANAFSNDADIQTVTGNIPDGYMGLDIGPESVEQYRSLLLEAKTVVWNGPMGVFEMSNFADGTKSIAQALADATKKGTMTVVGGGDSVAAITQMGYEDHVSHVSTGGGAMLEFLEGKTLPGIAALSEK